MKKILVTDDNSDYRASVIELLQEEGYEVIGANDGAQALRLMVDERPQLVLCDIDMPTMNGLAVLQVAKGDVLLRKIPFIIVSGNTDEATINRIRELEADAYIQKPMDITELLALLKQYL